MSVWFYGINHLSKKFGWKPYTKFIIRLIFL
jgi:hypothetical protein